MDRFDELIKSVMQDVFSAENTTPNSDSGVQLLLLYSISKDLRRIADSLGEQTHGD